MIHFQDHALLLNERYKLWFGEYLVEEKNPGEVLAALNEATVAILSCGIGDPCQFNYGNVQSLSLYGYELGGLIKIQRDEILPIDTRSLTELDANGFCQLGAGIESGPEKRRWRLGVGSCWQPKDFLGRLHGTGFCFSEYSRI